ncbi:MAG: tripartite tricarboxylate transporter TctB family protein [Zoogloeaceae bacterium]|nr:tripartite tricarboxylate transporter TctB family protein [Zoogloeaceae bacterium]
MSERILGGLLLFISIAGIWIARSFEAPFSYEPVGPRAFPMLILALLGISAIALILEKKSDTTWAPPPVMKRIGVLFVIILIYAWLFDKLGFVLATALMVIPIARFFSATWKQAVAGGVGLGVGLFILFDRLLDVALPTGLWLNNILG